MGTHASVGGCEFLVTHRKLFGEECWVENVAGKQTSPQTTGECWVESVAGKQTSPHTTC
eukprot:JP445633.1.p3 GENE.JP445633.1~~JP445633.1.p3  ORF type:complete len:59 (+),score=3.05 JP445633.1:1-177(+)